MLSVSTISFIENKEIVVKAYVSAKELKSLWSKDWHTFSIICLLAEDKFFLLNLSLQDVSLSVEANRPYILTLTQQIVYR